MKKEQNSHIKLGVFVITGTLFLIIALYLIGSRQKLFGSVFTLKTAFKNVNGLMEGHSVRYGGIDVGTVKHIELTNDTTVMVEMIIDEKLKGLLKKNFVVSVGTDGLMGNKLLNISPGNSPSAAAQDGDMLNAKAAFEADAFFSVLNRTGENMLKISDQLKIVTTGFAGRNNLWKLLNDSSITQDIKSSLVSIKRAGENTLVLSGNLKDLSASMKNGKGVGALITDTTLSGRIEQIIVKIERAGDNAVIASGNLGEWSRKLNKSQGTIGMLLNDTAFAGNLSNSLVNLKKGSLLLNEDLEGLKHSFPLKKYFKKKKKAEQKKKKP